MGYRVYGPYEWMMRQINHWSHGGWRGERRWYSGQLADTYFHEYQRNVAKIKLDYMWGPQGLKQVHFPQWITDFRRAKTLGDDPDVRVTRTMFYLVEIRSRYPKDGPGWLSPGSYVTNGDLPMAVWVNGWEDPTKWEVAARNRPAVPRTCEWVWEDKYSYETTEDSQIGIRRQTDANGNVVWQKVYMVAQWVFGGIDVGGEVQVTNPANYSDRNALPGPILMDTAVGDYDVAEPYLPHHDQGVRRGVFTYLGVAGANDTAMVWPQKFRGANPFGGVCATAQAEIFNTTSWDLWTQDWKAKLVPVSGWRDWTERMETGAADAHAAGGEVSEVDILDVQRYFSRFDEQMAEESLHH